MVGESARDRVTLEAVARQAFVAKSTASRALRGDPRISAATRRRVTAAALAVGYDPLAERAGPRVAGVVTAAGMEHTFADRFQMDVLAGVADGMRALDMCVLFVPPFGSPGHDEVVTRIPFDVAFLLHDFSTFSSTRASLERRGIPVVVAEPRPGETAPGVGTNERGACRELMAALVAAGHQSAAVVALPLTHRRRHRGWVAESDLAAVELLPTKERLAAMADAGLRVERVFETVASAPEEGRRAAAALMELPQLPTAVVCQSDLLAVGVVTGLRAAGIEVPRDVSVTGFDALDLPVLAPLVLSSVSQDGFLKGGLLAEQAARALRGELPGATYMQLTARMGNSIVPPRSAA